LLKPVCAEYCQLVDTIAHGLTGALIGYCGFRQRGGSESGRAALWTCIAAAEFPDIDIGMAYFGGNTYLRWHRSFTHSAVLLPLWAAVVAWAFWQLSGRKKFRLLYAASVTGMASHLILDWLTNYGTELLWPLNDARFALSWVFIVDPYVWVMLGIGLAAAIFTQREKVARVGLAVVCGYFLFCSGSRAYALNHAPRTAATRRLDAFPQPLNPLRWTIVRDDGPTIHWINGTHNDTFVQFHDDKLLPKAEATKAVKLFHWFAAFPLVEKLQENGRIVLRYRDLRFRTVFPNGRVNEGMFAVARVAFDNKGNVIIAGLGSGPE
jgi:inner membrane protein